MCILWFGSYRQGAGRNALERDARLFVVFVLRVRLLSRRTIAVARA